MSPSITGISIFNYSSASLQITEKISHVVMVIDHNKATLEMTTHIYVMLVCKYYTALYYNFY